ncbi:arginine--tRNA ligase [bacterium (Candidatus Torokbacteria) CG_4_10_14_0_2_um_filter_35_8]|nr:MAG: arginine--tRNA ligase [bacterium (Candidatus Torokbacteria) CG_4_10_14_0_2_um_filter_35_8]
MIKTLIKKTIKGSIKKLQKEEKLPVFDLPEFKVEHPKEEKFGDYSCNISLILGNILKKSPQEIGEQIVEDLKESKERKVKLFRKVGVVKPGFINFYLSDEFLQSEAEKLATTQNDLWEFNIGKGKKAQVEFVSANPTGPLHLGHGRQAAIGDSLARVLALSGYKVTKEYYFNDEGQQMRNLTESVYARYRQLLGDKDFPLPERGYEGEYIRDIAKKIVEKEGDKFQKKIDKEHFKKYAEECLFALIKKTLKNMGVIHDIFYNESDLYKEGKVDALVKTLKEKCLAYNKDGALWLKLSKMGRKDDKVIVKASSDPTYRLPDIAYHIEKIKRGFDLIIDIFGSDHAEEYPDVLAVLKALGYDESKVKVIIHQFVTLKGGKKMSKRKGTFVTLDQIIDEVGGDVTRFLFLEKASGTHIELDLNLAKDKSEKNPVYYIQYAHARICSILRKTEDCSLDTFDEKLLKHKSELVLVKKILEFPEIIYDINKDFGIHRLCYYAYSLATCFSGFYRDCKVISGGKDLTQARLSLIILTKKVLALSLKLLGINAPEKM